ncbi:hypothetical protein EJ03DRAFT_160542 [Teratosphaeria nubilosa]|uniref:Uncharacterized protein n=1 Tax=Teratosphaeria nubilosa TaxID=161662 RepID=A0A6G1L2U8_9PEZI|nr:hypothetical protein EJ03DRAFT_160542 [Teratosphaeria nubilosa]
MHLPSLRYQSLACIRNRDCALEAVWTVAPGDVYLQPQESTYRSAGNHHSLSEETHANIFAASGFSPLFALTPRTSMAVWRPNEILGRRRPIDASIAHEQVSPPMPGHIHRQLCTMNVSVTQPEYPAPPYDTVCCVWEAATREDSVVRTPGTSKRGPDGLARSTHPRAGLTNPWQISEAKTRQTAAACFAASNAVISVGAVTMPHAEPAVPSAEDEGP